MGRRPIPVKIKHCAQCGKPMQRKRYGAALEDRSVYARRKFCDQKCMARWQEGRIKIQSDKASRRQSVKAMKSACERCGSIARRHVHHLDGNPQNNAASNLLTLCGSCHRQAHSPHFNAITGQRLPCKHCGKPAMKRGLCWTHQTRFAKYGNPLLRKVKRGSLWILEREASS